MWQDNGKAALEYRECFFVGVQYAACLYCTEEMAVAMRMEGCPKLKLGCQKSRGWRNLGVNYGVIYNFKPQVLGVTVYEVAICPAPFFTWVFLAPAVYL